MFNNKTIIITGGTGSFGKAFVEHLLKKYKKIKKLIIFSRDEYKQYDLKKNFPESKFKCLRYFLGDVRDLNRLNLAFRDVDYVVHAAALKQVDTAEYNPFEFINTNIIGAQNVIEAAMQNKVKKVIALLPIKRAHQLIYMEQRNYVRTNFLYPQIIWYHLKVKHLSQL